MHQRLSAAAALILATTLSCPSLRADDAPAETSAAPATQGILPIPTFTGDLWTRDYLTGDWDGSRTDLANRGIQLEVNFTQYVQGVINGGLDRTTRYGGHLDTLLRLDLMKMGVLPGAIVTFRAQSRYGDSVNGKTGLALPVNTAAFFPLTGELDEDQLIAITDLNYTQFLSEHFGVMIGKLNTLDADLNEFASGRGRSQFMDANFLFNGTTALRLPYSTLGVAAVWLPTKDIVVKANLINTVDSSTTTGFDDFGDGLTLGVEAAFQYRLGRLPGGMNVGVLYSFDQDFTEVGGKFIFQPGQGLSIEDEDETWAVYWSLFQYLCVEGEPAGPVNVSDGRADHQGVGVFARFGVADDDTNPVEWSISFGFGGRGIIPSRDNDTFGLGYYYTSVQRTRLTGIVDLENQSQGFEAYYNIALTPAAQLTIDFQLQESVLSSVNTAVIWGLRLNLAF